MNNDNFGNAKSLAFVHHKGGTGKTTACINIGGYLAKMGKKVLVVDLDPQGNATAGLGIDRKSLDDSIYDVLFGQRSLEEIVLETESGIHLAPSSIDLLAAELQISEIKNPTGLLQWSLEEIRDHYDYILIDVPPGSTILMVNGIIAADALIVPIDAGVFGIETMETLRILLRQIREELGVEMPILLTLLRSYPKPIFGKDPNKVFWSLLEDFLKTHHFSDAKIVKIPYSRNIPLAQMKGLPISHFKPNCKVAKTFKKITEEILSR